VNTHTHRERESKGKQSRLRKVAGARLNFVAGANNVNNNDNGAMM